MLDYFASNPAFSDTAAAFQREAEIEGPPSDRAKGLLAKKWTTIVRLSKQVPSNEFAHECI